MELTPTDVEQKAFTQALRGYQMDEVDDFLDEIVTALRGYDQRLRDAQEKIRALEADASSRGGDETTISRAILVAQRSADSLLAEAKVDADRIRNSAKAEAESLHAEREMERNRAQTEIDGMRQKVSGLRQTLAVLVEAVGGRIGEMESEISNAEGTLEQTLAEDAEPIEAARGLFPSGTDSRAPGRTGQEAPAHLGPMGAPAGDLSRDADGGQPDDEGEDFEEREIGSRVSSRPWERG
jgi:cell division initiation protein